MSVPALLPRPEVRGWAGTPGRHHLRPRLTTRGRWGRVPLFGRRKTGREADTVGGSAAGALEPLLLGEVPIDQWPAEPTPEQGEPWTSFVRARQALAAGRRDEAVAIWREIAEAPGLESRNTLQAWTYLRGAGVVPDLATGKVALGVVVVVSMGRGHDTLAGYRDGTVRYLNHAGGASIIDSPTPAMAAANSELTAAGQQLANLIGPWGEPALPPLPASATRLIVLTPSGPHFGQASYEDLHADPMARPVLDSAVRLLQLVVDQSTPSTQN